ncbi:hypothetical protein ACTFIR_002292 [Dictyostelium discoideum]
MSITCKCQPGKCNAMTYNRCPCRLELNGCNENCTCSCFKANSINGQSPKVKKSKVVEFKKNKKNNPNTLISSNHGINKNNNINPYRQVVKESIICKWAIEDGKECNNGPYESLESFTDHIYYDHTPSVNTISTCKILPCDGTDKCKFKCTKAIILAHLKDKHNN